MSSQQAMTRATPSALDPFRRAFDTAQAHFAKALPQTVARYLTPDRLTKVALNAIGRTPALLACEPLSVLRAVMDAATLGLEAGSPLGHAYLVPYGKTCQLIIGYRGLIELARRSGNIQSVEAHCVFERDRFTATFGLDAKLEHEPAWDGDRGELKAVYCVARFVGGGTHIDVMTRADVERIRGRSKAGNNGPWKTDYNEMARKTVVRRAAKYWPLSLELAEALDIETKHGTANDDDVLIFDADSGEVETMQQEPKASTDKMLDKLKAAPATEPEVVETKPAEKPIEDELAAAEAKWAADKAAKDAEQAGEFDPDEGKHAAAEEEAAKAARIEEKKRKEQEFIARGKKAKSEPGSDG